MKKFVFTLQKYQDMKTNEYEELKRELQNVDKDIEAVLSAIVVLMQRFEAERQSYNKACREGVRADQLRTYQWFLPYLHEEQLALQKELIRHEEKRKKLREALFKLHNEQKVLLEMREDQYQEYLRDVATDEAKELDSHLSFTIYEGAV